jgi:hypothetical protein
MAAVQSVEDGNATFEEGKLRARARAFGRTEFQERFFGRVRQAWLAAGKPEARLPLPGPLAPVVARGAA